MCLALPGKIIKIDGKNAITDIMGAERKISIELLKDLKLGDYVLIHAGCAIQVIDEQSAKETIQLFNEIEEISNG